MPRWLHIVLQVLSTAAGAYISYKTGSPLPSVISTGVSGLTGVIQQQYNTDGTPQAAAVPAPARPCASTASCVEGGSGRLGEDQRGWRFEVISIPNVKLPELRALIEQLQQSGQAQITGTGMTSGTITAHHFLMPTINASYALADDTLDITSNVFEPEIQAELEKRIAALRTAGV